MADIESTLLGHLEYLYRADAGAVLGDLLNLMRSWRERIGVRSGTRLTERDVVLITYGDMVREPERAPLATLDDFLSRSVGDVVNTIHILPFFPYSSDDGFSVIDYRAVAPELGEWADVARLRRTFRLMVDAVLNHVSAESEWFRAFREGDETYRRFFTVVEPETDLTAVFRPRELPLLTEVDTVSGRKLVWTTFSADQIDLNYRNPAVLLEAVDVLLNYVARGADLIRLDAIAFIWKELGSPCIHLPQTHRIIQLLRAVLDEVAPGVTIITETNVPHPDNVSYFGDGSNEAHLVYNFALPPLTLHAFHIGDARALSAWAAELQTPSSETMFFNFLASHDGIGVGGARGYISEEEIAHLAAHSEQLGGNVSYRNAPDGKRAPYELNINFLDALGEAEGDEPDDVVARRFLTSQALMLSLQGVPGIYFHSMFGSRGWPEGVAATGAVRTVNRQKLDRAQLEAELSRRGSLREQVFTGYRRLLQARASHQAFSPVADQQVLELHSRVFAVLRTRDRGTVLCLHNVSGDPVEIDVAEVLPTGSHADLIQPTRKVGRILQLGPFETAWLTGERS